MPKAKIYLFGRPDEVLNRAESSCAGGMELALVVMVEYSCVDGVELSGAELSQVVMVEYSCVGGVKLSRVVMVEWCWL